MKSLVCINLCLVAVLAVSLVGCNNVDAPTSAGQPAGGGVPPIPEVQVYTVGPEQVDLPGAYVIGYETTPLMANIQGYVKELRLVRNEKVVDDEVDIGTLVQSGDVLAVLDVPELQDELAEKRALVDKAESEVKQADAAIAQADAKVKQAQTLKKEKETLLTLRQKEFDRIFKLNKEGAVEEDKVLEAEYARNAVDAAIQSAEAEVQAAQADLKKAKADKHVAQNRKIVAEKAADRVATLSGYTQIKAPFAGVVTKRLVDRGAFVRPASSNSGGMPLFQITRIDKLRVVASVPTTNAAKVVVGQSAVFRNIGGLPGVEVSDKKITRSAKALDPDLRMMRIEIHLDNPIEGLKPGMYGTVTISLWDEDYQVLVVPNTAVAKDPTGKSYVMVVESRNGDRKACRQQHIDVAFQDEKQVGITSGVESGDLVVLSGVDKLKDGQEIKIKSD